MSKVHSAVARNECMWLIWVALDLCIGRVLPCMPVTFMEKRKATCNSLGRNVVRSHGANQRSQPDKPLLEKQSAKLGKQ